MSTWTHGYPAPRRTQFSSCDSCRRSRVACDASKFGYQAGEVRWSGSCSRCATRNRRCTFEIPIANKEKWMKKLPQRQQRNQGTQVSHTLNPVDFGRSWDIPDDGVHENESAALLREPDIFHTYNLPYERASSCDFSPIQQEAIISHELSPIESADALLTQCAHFVFNHSFGAIFGRWVGRNGCPLVNEPNSDISIPPNKLFSELDSYTNERLHPRPLDLLGTPFKSVEREEQIDRYLHRAMQAYAARWLPVLVRKKPGEPSTKYNKIIRSSWRAARRDMLKVINRPSYRSVLALYLFSETPVPAGISKEEELDGINGVLCSQTLLIHVQQLRERLRSCRFNGSEVSAWSDEMNTITSNVNSSLTEEYLSLESRVYWASVTWDTSSSMTLNFRSSLSSGLKGTSFEPVWHIAKGFLVGSFRTQTEEWAKQGVRVSDEVASQTISAASICTIYTWRTIASLKEALREGVEESTVQFIWNTLLDAIEVFKTVIQPVMSNCERRLHFLGQVDRLNWYEIVLLYYLGILMLVDALEAADRSDLLQGIEEMRIQTEEESINILKFGLESKYIISDDGLDSVNTAYTDRPVQPLSVSFIAIDPYPHHVTALVRLMNKAILKKYVQSYIKHETYLYLYSTLEKALEQLPQSSKAVLLARENLQCKGRTTLSALTSDE